MERLKSSMITACLLCSPIISCADQPIDCLPLMGGEYLAEPQVFPIGDIKTGNGISFSSDGCTLFITQKPGEFAEIYQTRFNGENWTTPVLLRNLTQDQEAYQPRLSPDGTKLYFNSSRAIPGSEFMEGIRKSWVSEYVEGEWSVPDFAQFNTRDPSLKSNYATPVRDGSVYFRSTRTSTPASTEDIDNADVFVSRFKDGKLQSPTRVAEVSHGDISDVFVTPDEKIMLLIKWDPVDDDPKIHLSISNNNKWSNPRKLDSLDLPGWELTPTISPDGNYLLFEKRGVIHIISLKAILNDREKSVLLN